MICDFGAPGAPPKGPGKLKFVEPISVWYQVKTPGPPPQQFLCPLQKINSCFGTSQMAPGRDTSTTRNSAAHYLCRVLPTVAVHQCLNGRAPPYLSEHCIPVSSADTRRHLRSANRHLLAVPRFRLNTYGRRAFSVAGPMAWNSLPDFIRDPTSSTEWFRRLLKRTCSRVTSASSALGALYEYALYKSTHSLTHSLTHTQQPSRRRRNCLSYPVHKQTIPH